MRPATNRGGQIGLALVKFFGVLMCDTLVASGCIGSDEITTNEDLITENQTVEGDNPSSPDSEIFAQEVLAWEQEVDEFELDAPGCECSGGFDIDCEYVYWPATMVCHPDTDATTQSMGRWGAWGWAWQNEYYQDYLTCVMPSIYPYHLGPHHQTIESVMMCGRDYNPDQALSGSIYGENVYYERSQGDFEGTISFSGSSAGVSCLSTSVVWNVGNPWMYVHVRVPEEDDDHYSYLSGFRICYDF